MNQPNQKSIDSIRPALFAGLLISIIMLITALFFQYYMGLEPCPLCSITRVIVIIMASVFLIAFIHAPLGWGRRLYGLLLTLISTMGIVVAGRHVWLQYLPKEQIPECGPGLDFWLNNLPANEVIQNIFQGSGECAEITWTLIGLSIPQWNLIIFILFLVYSLKLLILSR